ncbi:MAG: MBL fold metallo-hydrolase [Bacteroidota bacterium]
MMKLTFLGTGTSMGVPVAGGFLRDQLAHDARNERTRCSAWIQTPRASLVIDTGPEFRIQSIKARIPFIDAVLLTHEHMDHVAGLDDLRSFGYERKNPIPLFGDERTLTSIRTRFDYLFGDNKYPGSVKLALREVSNTSFAVEDCDITPLPVLHGALPILGYRINNLAYLTDVKSIPEETISLLKGVDTLVISGLRWEPEHPTHLTIPETVLEIERIQPRKAFLIHMNSYVDHESSNRKLPDHIKLAYDQQIVAID